jgi:hypothetical protein
MLSDFDVENNASLSWSLHETYCRLASAIFCRLIGKLMLNYFDVKGLFKSILLILYCGCAYPANWSLHPSNQGDDRTFIDDIFIIRHNHTSLGYLGLQTKMIDQNPHSIIKNFIFSPGFGYRTFITPHMQLGGYLFVDVGGDLTSWRLPSTEDKEDWVLKEQPYFSIFSRWNLGFELTRHSFRGNCNFYLPGISAFAVVRQGMFKNLPRACPQLSQMRAEAR